MAGWSGLEQMLNKKVHSIHSVGDIISLTKYAKVTYNRNGQLGAVDLHNNLTFEIQGADLQEECLSADKIVDCLTATKTELADILTKSHGKPFTVEFTKADGKDRKIRGRLLSSEGLMGRSTVEDLDKTIDDRVRLVDHRTLKSIIVDNTKWTLK